MISLERNFEKLRGNTSYEEIVEVAKEFIKNDQLNIRGPKNFKSIEFRDTVLPALKIVREHNDFETAISLTTTCYYNIHKKSRYSYHFELLFLCLTIVSESKEATFQHLKKILKTILHYMYCVKSFERSVQIKDLVFNAFVNQQCRFILNGTGIIERMLLKLWIKQRYSEVHVLYRRFKKLKKLQRQYHFRYYQSIPYYDSINFMCDSYITVAVSIASATKYSAEVCRAITPKSERDICAVVKQKKSLYECCEYDLYQTIQTEYIRGMAQFPYHFTNKVYKMIDIMKLRKNDFKHLDQLPDRIAHKLLIKYAFRIMEGHMNGKHLEKQIWHNQSCDETYEYV